MESKTKKVIIAEPLDDFLCFILPSLGAKHEFQSMKNSSILTFHWT